MDFNKLFTIQKYYFSTSYLLNILYNCVIILHNYTPFTAISKIFYYKERLRINFIKRTAKHHRSIIAP